MFYKIGNVFTRNSIVAGTFIVFAGILGIGYELFNNTSNPLNRGFNINPVSLTYTEKPVPLNLKPDEVHLLWAKMEIKALEKPEEKLQNVGDIRFNSTHIIVADYVQNRFLIYDRQDGKLITDITIPGNKGDCVDIDLNWQEKILIIGNNAEGELYYLDFDGVTIDRRKVPFHFLKFHYFKSSNRFLFYLPNVRENANVSIKEKPAIVITDGNFNIKKSLFSITELMHKAPFFTPFRLWCGDKLCYYNPDFSDKIFSIDANGEVQLVYDYQIAGQDYYTMLHEIVDQYEDMKLYQNLHRTIAIDKFFVSDKVIVTDHNRMGIHEDILLLRDLNRLVSIRNRIPVTDVGKKFQFAYSSPTASNALEFCKLWTRENYNYVLAQVAENAALKHLPVIDDNVDHIVMFYMPDLDYIAERAGIKVENPRYHASLIIYPNPAETVVNIELENVPGLKELTIFSMEGKIMYQKHLKMNNEEQFKAKVDVAGWPKNIYIVSVAIEGEHRYSSIINVQ